MNKGKVVKNMVKNIRIQKKDNKGKANYRENNKEKLNEQDNEYMKRPSTLPKYVMHVMRKYQLSTKHDTKELKNIKSKMRYYNLLNK